MAHLYLWCFRTAISDTAEATGQTSIRRNSENSWHATGAHVLVRPVRNTALDKRGDTNEHPPQL
jgi:hypothetical protein